MYEYKAEFIRAVDGDTVVLNVDLGFKVWIKETFRLLGVNTPELNSKDPAVRAEAQRAAAFITSWLSAADSIRIRTTKPDKYGRWLADIIVTVADEEVSISGRLLEHGLAVAYP